MFRLHCAALLSVLCAAAHTGLNVNHALYETRQVSSSEGSRDTRRLGDSSILSTLHAIEVLRADFAYVAKEFLCIAMGGHDSNIFAGITASLETALNGVKAGDPSKSIIAPPSNDTTAAVDLLVSETTAFHGLLRNNLGGTIPPSTWETIDTAYNRLADAYESALRQYEAYGNMKGVAEAMVQNYAYRLESYSEKIVVQAFFYVENVRPSHYLSQVRQYRRRFTSLIESITWGDIVAGIDDLTNVCQLQAMVTVTQDWFQLEAGLQDLSATTTPMEISKELVAFSDKLRSSVKALNVQIEQPSCQPLNAMDETAWKSGITQSAHFRELVAKAARVFLEAEVFFLRIK